MKFQSYYEENNSKIGKDIKQKVLEKLFIFYSLVFRFLIRKKKDLSSIPKKENVFINSKHYKSNESLLSFSAIQELGMWLPFEEKKQNKVINKLKIFNQNNLDTYIKHVISNFPFFFTSDNINLCEGNKEVWENVRNSIEDISITLPTILKMIQDNNKNNKLILLVANELRQDEKNQKERRRRKRQEK